MPCVDLGEADAKNVWQLLVLLWPVKAIGNAGGVKDAPEAVAGVSIVTAAPSGRERRIVAAEDEL